MKRIVIALLLISGASSVCRAQMLTYDAQNFVQALLGYLRDGETSAENAALFLEDIGISTEMLSNIREWNDRYREISQAVATAKAVLDIAASYEQTYADFAYFVSGFKELDMDYYEVQSYVNEAWYYLLLVSGEIRRCREYFKPGMSMTDWERLDRVERTERRMKLIQSALSAYIADTFGLIDYARAAEYNMAELQDAFSVPYWDEHISSA